MQAQTTEHAEHMQAMRTQRDHKARPHLSQYAPVWMVSEEFDFDDDAIRFEVVFHHPRYRWVKRRYRYDVYNDVLYYMGQILLSEEAALDIEATEPYISADMINTLDAYGG